MTHVNCKSTKLIENWKMHAAEGMSKFLFKYKE